MQQVDQQGLRRTLVRAPFQAGSAASDHEAYSVTQGGAIATAHACACFRRWIDRMRLKVLNNSDGTRLRVGPAQDAAFSGHILNDTMCTPRGYNLFGVDFCNLTS